MQREDAESWDPFSLGSDSAFIAFQVLLGLGKCKL